MLWLLVLFIGCASTPKVSFDDASHNLPFISLSDSWASKKRLSNQVKYWKNVKYKLGGLSKKGIDCSGFVYLTFRSEFGIQLPRTTWRQASIGKPVKRKHLKIGDLVFFKTSRSVRHVGIYMGAGTFIHASTSRGVTISRLDNVYWKKRYWKAVRVSS